MSELLIPEPSNTVYQLPETTDLARTMADLSEARNESAKRSLVFPEDLAEFSWAWAKANVLPIARSHAERIGKGRRVRIACAIGRKGVVYGGVPMHMENSRQAATCIDSALARITFSAQAGLFFVALAVYREIFLRCNCRKEQVLCGHAVFFERGQSRSWCRG